VALVDANEALRISPKEPSYHSSRAGIFIGLHEYERAVEDLDYAIANIEDPASLSQFHYGRGNAHKYQGEYKQAIGDLTQAIALNPDFAWAINSRGDAYAALGEYDLAFQDFARAKQLAPEWALPYCNSGNTFLKQGEYKKALVEYEKAIALEEQHEQPSSWTIPARFFVYLTRARAFQQMGDYKRAQDDLDTMVRLFNELPAAYAARVELWESQGEYKKALEDLTLLLELEPENALAYHQRAMMYQKSGEYDLAIDDYSTAIKFSPEDYRHYVMRATAYSDSGDEEAALQNLARALKLNPKSFEAYFNRGLVFFRQQEYQQALEDFDRAIELNPELTQGHLMLGEVHGVLEEYEEAIDDYTRALEIDPTTAEAYKSRASLYERQGKYQLALADYDESVKIDPTDEEVLSARAALHEKQGNASLATTDYVAIISTGEFFYTYDTDMLIEYCLEHNTCQQAMNELVAIIDEGDPPKAAAYYARGRLHEETGRLNEAIADYVQAVEYAPSGWLASKIVSFCRGSDLYEFATQALATAIEASPENGWLHYTRGQLNAEQGDLTLAVDDFTQAIEIDASQETWLRARAETHERLGEYALALEDYVQVVTNRPSSSFARRELARYCQRTDQCVQAVAQLTTAIDEQPDSSQLLLARAEVYQTWDPRAELEDYNRAIVLDPLSADAFKARAQVREKLGDFEGALADYGEAVWLNEFDNNTAEDIVRLCQQLDNCEDVIAQLSNVLEHKGITASLFLARGRVYEASGDNEAAIIDFSNAIKMSNEAVWSITHSAYFRRADLYNRQGSLSKAIEDYTVLIEDYEVDLAYYHRGLIYKQLGKTDLALHDFQAYLETNPPASKRTEVEKEIAELTN